MKLRKWFVCMLCGCTLLSLAACGSDAAGESGEAVTQESTQEVPPIHQMNVDEVVTLGDYRNLALAMPTPSEEEVEYYSRYYFNQLCKEEFGIKDRAVETGDTINLDYSGVKEGETEPFQGGTAQSQCLTIGSDQFIDGFEDGLIGVMPGETVDLNLTFPENYGGDLSGANVVFTCTVNYIIPAEMTDEIVTSFSLPEVTDVASFKSYIEGLMKSYVAQDMEEAIIDALLEQTTYNNIPENLIQKKAEQIREQLSQYATNAGTTIDDYVASNYSMEAEAFISKQADEISKIFLTAQAIANREGLGVSDEDLEKTLSDYASSLGYTDVDTFLDEYAGASREDYREQIMLTNVIDFLTDVVNNK